MRLSDAFPSRYAKAAELPLKGLLCTISSVDMETFDDSEKLVVAFSDHPKLLALNKTNAKTIEAITGSEETNDWVGAQIVMFPTTTDYAGKRVACIRVRAPRTTPPAATLAAPKPAGPPPSDLDDEIPF